MFSPRLLAPLIVASLVQAQGQVLVVDASGGPGSNFTSLGPAVASAQSGDVLLVRSGGYLDSIVLDGKSLTVIADAGASVQIAAADVEDIAAGGVVLIR